MVAVPGPVPVSARSEAVAPIRWPDPGTPIFSSDPAAWPLSSHLELGALDSAVPCARLHARHVVREWGRPDLADTAELLVSELMTNAIRASGPWPAAVALWLFSDGWCVVIHVHDGSSAMPVRQDADAESESGHGLLLVETLSRDWGSYRSGDGKVVWASIG